MRHNKDDNNDLEKLRRNNSDIILEINIKTELAKKMRLIVWRIFSRRISISTEHLMTNNEVKNL